ncbi:hypothetical protein V8B55DRAFT_1460610 [Mucor lusitanicus]|uniref:WW domain-containing protein n=1 Tax=Mucor lusitanicus CBS 277.49 TaxID=747725 RepID=A0A168KKW6_MUCCL|nr:hypothetical protein MUCCIDRAFT_156554 [Mucor lusitanicus CBS 277.49]
MNQGSPPPQLPPGWIALWDETTQRYYYVEQATGTTQWELPSGASRSAEAGMGGAGEASSYGGGYPQQSSSPYPQQPGASPNAAVATAYPTQDGTPTGELNPDGTDRGIGKVFSGFSGGAITGSLIGYAAGKYFNKPKYQNQYQPPPPPAGGFGFNSFAGGFGGGNNNYGGHQGGGGHHGGHHGHGGHGNQYGGPPGPPGGYGGVPGFPGYNPPVAGKKHGW